MSLAVVVKGPEGLVLAADSRVTLNTEQQLLDGTKQLLPTYFDNAIKLMQLQDNNIGIVTYGMGAIGQHQPRMAHGYIPEFEAHLAEVVPGEEVLSVERVAAELAAFFAERWGAADMGEGAEPMAFLVAGYDDGEAYGRVYEVSVPNALEPQEQFRDEFSIVWRGQPYLLERLLNGTAPRAIDIAKDALGLSDEQVSVLAGRWQQELALPIPIPFLPLQDAVDLATFLVDMTATVMTWTVGIQGVGGQVDVATITRTNGFSAVETKKIHPWG
jgi:hypothetical protein